MSLADRVAGRNVLVAGGLGFIGSNLAIRLVEYGARVTLIDSLDERLGGNRYNIDPIKNQVELHIADLCTAPLHALVAEMDFICNLTGQVSHQESMRDPQFDLEVNCLSTLRLLEACRQTNPTTKVLFTSTRQVYGKPQKVPVNEEHPTSPIDINGIHKLAAEQYHLLYHRVHGIQSTVLRLTNTFGPRQRISTSHSGFAGFFIYQALRGQMLRVYGPGDQHRDFSYVDDVVDAILLAMTTATCAGQVYNLGSRATHTISEFVAAMREFCDLRVEHVPFPVESQKIEIGDYRGDYSRFQAATGWQPAVELRQALELTFAYYQKYAAAYGL